MGIITNKEETIGFCYIESTETYLTIILSNHPHYNKFENEYIGCEVDDPSCIGYDCWVQNGGMVSGKVLDGTIILGQGAYVDRTSVVRNSFIDVGGGLEIVNGSKVEGLTVSREGAAAVKLNISQSILSAKVNVWLTLSMEKVNEINIKNSIISGTTAINSSNLTIEDSNLSGGPFIICNDVRLIEGVFKSEPFEFNKKEKFLRHEW